MPFSLLASKGKALNQRCASVSGKFVYHHKGGIYEMGELFTGIDTGLNTEPNLPKELQEAIRHNGLIEENQG